MPLIADFIPPDPEKVKREEIVQQETTEALAEALSEGLGRPVEVVDLSATLTSPVIPHKSSGESKRAELDNSPKDLPTTPAEPEALAFASAMKQLLESYPSFAADNLRKDFERTLQRFIAYHVSRTETPPEGTKTAAQMLQEYEAKWGKQAFAASSQADGFSEDENDPAYIDDLPF